jgi:hypothetical protein
VTATKETRSYKFVHVADGDSPAADWIRDQFGIDPKLVSSIDLHIAHSEAVTVTINAFLTTGALDAFPPMEEDNG